MKASNPQVMVQAYRLLINKMDEEFGECYPLHLGVTEAGDGEDGRIKSAIGIGSLLEDGIGDTIRVSLTEDPEFEIPVCRDIVKRYQGISSPENIPGNENLTYSPFQYKRRSTFVVGNMGGSHVPVVTADLSKQHEIKPASLSSIGYDYDAVTDKWHIADIAADYVYTGSAPLNFELPGTLKVILNNDAWENLVASSKDTSSYLPIFDVETFTSNAQKHADINFVMVDCTGEELSLEEIEKIQSLGEDRSVVLCLSSVNKNAMQSVRKMFCELDKHLVSNPVILITDSNCKTADEHLIHFATETGSLLLDGMGDGICLGMSNASYTSFNEHGNILSGRRYSTEKGADPAGRFMNNTAFIILQATRTRISKTEYISCPSCGRTLFDLQETTAKIRARTNHLKGVKIAIMGCIVNGPGEMADADFGYVGSGVGKITLYRGKEIVKRNVDSEIAVDELINLLKENESWVEPNAIVMSDI
jgi:(E)-4-hydroxy-3-methylbut-2-enyl-diphosphate synthase